MIFLASALLAGCLWAQEALPPLTEKDCPTVDLSDKFGPVRNQGKIGSCFAFATADLLGYTARITPMNQVSAIDVQMAMYAATEEEIRTAVNKQSQFAIVQRSLKYLPAMVQILADHKASSSPLEAFDGGLPWLAALAYNTRAGLCTETQLPSTGPQAFVSSNFFVRDQISKLSYDNKHADFLTSLWMRSRFVPSLSMLDLSNQIDRAKGIPCAPKVNPLRRSAEYIDGAFKQMYKEMDEKVEKACGQRIPIEPIMSQVISLKENGAKEAAKLLSSKPPYPFLWSFDQRFLQGGPDVGPRTNEDGHASVVVGMHWDGNKCQFKMRNSWGISCDKYHESLRPGCKDGVLTVSQDLVDKYSHMAMVMKLDEKPAQSKKPADSL